MFLIKKKTRVIHLSGFILMIVFFHNQGLNVIDIEGNDYALL